MDEDPDAVGLARLVLFGNAVHCVATACGSRTSCDATLRSTRCPSNGRSSSSDFPGRGRPTWSICSVPTSGSGSMPLWESYEPVPDPSEPSDADGVDPRWTRCNGMWEAMRATVPYVAAMHPMEPDHIHEEIELQLADFASYNQEWVSRAPKWRDYHLSHDQGPHYRYMRTAPQILQWRRPRERWVLSRRSTSSRSARCCPSFPMPPSWSTHRDPVAVVQSTATMMAYSARMAYRHTMPEWYVDTGPTASVSCWPPRSAIDTCSRRTERSTCTSTSTWPTRWAPCSTSTTRRVWSSPPRPGDRSTPIATLILGQGGPGRVRPATRLLRDSGRGACTVCLLLRPFRHQNRGRYEHPGPGGPPDR